MIRSLWLLPRALTGLVAIATLSVGGGSAAALPVSQVAVPRPDLTSFETPVRSQIEDERRALDEALVSMSGEEASELGALFGHLGQTYHAYSLDDAASACYTNALVFSPEESRWPYLAGVVAEQQGDAGAARELFERALEADPDDLAALLRLAGVLLELGSGAEAEAVYGRSLLVETTAAAYFGLGRIAYEQESYAAAIEHLERTLELQPSADRAHYHLARAHRRQGDSVAAREHLRRAGPDVPVFPDPRIEELEKRAAGVAPLLERALEAFADRRYGEAIAAYREVLVLEPDNAVALSGLQASLVKSQDMGAAAAGALELIAQHPDDPRARLEVGRVLLSQDRVEESIEQLELAIELDPEVEAAYLELGAAYGRLDDWDRAAANFERSLALDPEAPAARYALALARAKQGRREEGIELLWEIVRQDPNHVAARQQLGRLLAEQGDLSAAEAQHEAVLEIDEAAVEEKAAAHYQLGRIRARQNRPADALAHDREAARLSPELWQAHFAIARTLIAGGRYSEAADRLERLVAIQPELVTPRAAEADALMRAGRFGEARSRLEQGLAGLPQAAELAHLLARLLATAPAAELRDGMRALDLASQLVAKFPSVEHAETVVMALAELGRFDEAMPLQERLVSQLPDGGSDELSARLRANLGRYRRNEKARYP